MKLIRKLKVAEKTGLPPSTMYKLMKNGDFPLNVHLSKRSVAWVESEVDEWMEKRLEVRDVKNKKLQIKGE